MGFSSAIKPSESSALAYRPLGIFRFVLALLVVAQHFTNFAPQSFQQAVIPLGLGSIAVLVFFAVSGFVIAEAIEGHYRGRAGAFLVNRAIRIFPPLLAATTLTLLVIALLLLGGPFRHFEMHSTEMITRDVLGLGNVIGNYLQVLPGAAKLGFGMDYSMISVVWSIRTELMFYLVMAVIMLVPVRNYRQALAVAGIGALAVHYVAALTNAGPETLRLIPFFVYGIAVYYALNGSLTGLALSVLTWVLSLIALVEIGDQLPPMVRDMFGPFAMPARVIILGALLALIPALCRIKLPRTLPLDRYLGDLSYPLYLNHAVIMIVVGAVLPQAGWGGFALAVAAALALSVVMYRFIEPGLNTLRARVRQGRGNGIPASRIQDRVAHIPV